MDDRRPDDEPASKHLNDLLAAADARDAPTRPARAPVFRDAEAFRPPPRERPAFRGDDAFRNDRFEDAGDRATYGASLEEELRDDDLPLADRGTRLGARLIDVAIAFFLFMAVGMLIETGMSEESAGLIGLPLILVLAGYQIWLLTTRGQTIGKRALKIRVVDAAGGSNPGFGRACFLREVVPVLVWLVPVIGPLSVLGDALSIFRDDRRCLHDHLAKTVVVRDAD